MALLVACGWATEPEVLHEFETKAVFLFNFARFVEWPASAFSSPTEPLVIGVLGADPFGRFLDEKLRKERVNGRPLNVRRYERVDEISNCHILFVSGSEWANPRRIVERLGGQPILTVCDTALIARSGIMVELVKDDGHVRLRINREAARRAGLGLSAKLLRSAEIVGEERR
jgi:hypothetical protein